MLYSRIEQADLLCILRISTEVFNIEGAVISDMNASSNYVRFYSPSELNRLQLEQIYAKDWRHPGDPIAYQRHKSQKCAEVLVPGKIEPNYIIGAYVVNDSALAQLKSSRFSIHYFNQYPYIFQVKAMITAKIGNLFESSSQTLVNTINTVRGHGQGYCS